MTDFDVRAALQKYYRLFGDLQEKGGPEENPDLFEVVLHLQEDVLAHLGLPPADRYRQIFWDLSGAGKLSNKLLEKTETKLKKAAEKYLSRPAQTDLEVLVEARRKQLDPFDVLPELGHPTHDYTFYLYRVLLMNDLATPEEVLDELNRIKALNCYREVAELKFSEVGEYRQSPVFHQYASQLKYLDSYLLYEEKDQEE